eukprot:jgi/Botrbrau1/3545/Bobra.0078s0002.1
MSDAPGAPDNQPNNNEQRVEGEAASGTGIAAWRPIKACACCGTTETPCGRNGALGWESSVMLVESGGLGKFMLEGRSTDIKPGVSRLSFTANSWAFL